ncbi:MAG TPA: DUF1570 domain-containing protein [Isosphaeraceae bacterium]|jgi:hypothetical protein|nr:DUF1570 domain-containing protein [Isosphaeraceae bacterium]
MAAEWTCQACGATVQVQGVGRDDPKAGPCPFCQAPAGAGPKSGRRGGATLVGFVLLAGATLWAWTRPDDRPPGERPTSALAAGPAPVPRPRPSLPPLIRLVAQARPPRSASKPSRPKPADGPIVADAPAPARATGPAEAREALPARVLVADDSGKPVVARLYDGGGRLYALLPDGRLGQLKSGQKLVAADGPFEPATIDDVEKALLAGPFAGFRALRTDHYLVLTSGSEAFARRSGRLLDRLYDGLLAAFERNKLDVHPPEFPLVAVIFDTERAFRAHREVAPEVQAYYEILTNRIYFYEKSDHDRNAPEVAAMRRPQTVAHEGVHQVLQNIGLHPRLAPWPPWLVEGLAEYCGTTRAPRPALDNGGEAFLGDWERLGEVNPFHMATISDLQHPDDLHLQGQGRKARNIGKAVRRPPLEELVMKTDLTPTDYALAWALTHYLAKRRGPEFVAFLKAMGALKPGTERTPEQHLADFRAAFKKDYSRLASLVTKHLNSLHYAPIPYYAVVFEQDLRGGLMSRGGMVSQSPSVIRQWFDEMYTPPPVGGAVRSQVLPFEKREEARMQMMLWYNNR